MKSAKIFFSLIILVLFGLSFVLADLEDLDVATCTYAGCSVTEWNLNNTNTASAYGKNMQDDLTWTDTSTLGGADTVEDVKFHLRWSGTTNLNGNIDLTFNGVASECLFQIPENVNADNYNIVDISDCGGAPWTKADLDAMTLMIRNSDTAGGATLTNHFGTVIINFTAVGDVAPKWYTPSVNDTSPFKGYVVNHSVNWTDETALNHAFLEINSTGIGCDTESNISQQVLSGTNQWANISWVIPNACEGKVIGWSQWANDSSDAWNETDLQEYQVGAFLNMTWVSPTLANQSETQSPVVTNISIEDINGLSDIIYNWQGTNFTLFSNETILYLNMDNRSNLGENSTFVVDMSGWGNNATGNDFDGTGGMSNDGRYDGSLFLDGTNDFLEIPPNDVLNISDDNFTFMVWYNRTLTDRNMLVGLNWEYAQSVGIGIEVTDPGDSVVMFSGQSTHQGNNAVNLNQWTHVVITYNGTNSSIYLNGTLDSTQSLPRVQGGPRQTTIGAEDLNGANAVNGFMDEVIIINRSLTPEEIQQYYFSNVYKYEQDKYQLYVNQSLDHSTPLPNGNYTYFGCANDSLIGNCTTVRQVNVTPEVVSDDFLNLTFIPPTPANASTGEESPLEINVSIQNATILDTLIFNWNGTNTTLFNGSTILLMNFDNVSSLGENDTHFVDVSGSGNNGTAVGNAAPNISGRYGLGLNLNGGSSYANLSDTMDEIRTITISLWVNHTAYSGSFDDRAVSKAVGNGEAEHSFMISTVNGGWRARILVGGDGSTLAAGCENTHVLNRWEHIVLTYNGTTMKLYLNGTQICEREHAIGGLMDDQDAMTFIGANPPDGYAPFAGTIDDVMITNRSMNATEIQQLYFSNLYKINPDEWILYVNQSLNQSAPLENGTYNFYAWGDDTTTTNLTGIWEVEIGGAVGVECNYTDVFKSIWNYDGGKFVQGRGQRDCQKTPQNASLCSDIWSYAGVGGRWIDGVGGSTNTNQPSTILGCNMTDIAAAMWCDCDERWVTGIGQGPPGEIPQTTTYGKFIWEWDDYSKYYKGISSMLMALI